MQMNQEVLPRKFRITEHKESKSIYKRYINSANESPRTNNESGRCYIRKN